MASEVGIDLGTANVLVYIKNKGIVLNEPSVVAINKDTDEILAVGEEARQMLGLYPQDLRKRQILQAQNYGLRTERRYRGGEKSSQRGGDTGGR